MRKNSLIYKYVMRKNNHDPNHKPGVRLEQMKRGDAERVMLLLEEERALDELAIRTGIVATGSVVMAQETVQQATREHREDYELAT